MGGSSKSKKGKGKGGKKGYGRNLLEQIDQEFDFFERELGGSSKSKKGKGKGGKKDMTVIF